MPYLILWLAQTESSGFDDFFQQIAGLLIVTAGAGVIWMLLMVLIVSRARERRRRREQSLPPLPSAWEQFRTWLSGGDAESPKPPSSMAAPAPDLDALMSPLPAPGMEDLTKEFPVRGAASEADAPSAVPAQAPPPARVNAAEVGDMVEVLRVWRDLAGGGLVIEMDEQRFIAPEMLRGTGLEDRFTRVVKELQQMTSGPPTAQAQAPEPEPGNVAEEIDAFLQQRLALSGAYTDRDIHVRPSPDGGVLIVVDDVTYDTVGDVQEPDVRAFLQETIQAWERQ